MLDDFPQVVAALELVLHLAEDLADLVFDRVGRVGALLEAAQVRKELPSTKSLRSSPVMAALWSILPSAVFGAAQMSQRYGSSRMKCVRRCPSSAASVALSCSRASRYFRNRSHEVCSV